MTGLSPRHVSKIAESDLTGKEPVPASYTSEDPPRTVRRGSTRKREAIARAAMSLFAHDGYARTSVDAIAAAAGVSKRTVYDYYGDKNHLFLAVLEEAQAGRQARFTDIVRQTLGGDVGDPQAALMEFGREFAATLARSPDRAAVVRLIVTEAPHFPSLLERWRGPQPEQRALAEALTALADRGLLDLADPLEAAAQLAILVTTPINNHTLFGALPITDDEVERLVGSGVRLFLRAYRPGT